MSTPRENTSIVKAPVLFRLPHLQRAAAAARAASSGGFSAQRSDFVSGQQAGITAGTSNLTSAGSKQNPTVADKQTIPESTAKPAQPVSLTPKPEDSFLTRWGFDIKRSVILLAAMAILWGAWAIGQKPSTAPQESNLTRSNEKESDGDANLASDPVAIEPSIELPTEPNIPHIVEPKLSSSSGTSNDFNPVTEPQQSYYGSEDIAAADKPDAAADADTMSDFSSSSLDSLEPPGSGEFYGDYDLGTAAQSSAQTPPVMNDASTPSHLALNEPTSSPAAESPLPSATNFVPSATPELPGFDPNKVGTVENAAAENRPVLSSTPNGIIDWSRYLPGAGGNGSIRAVSATQTIGASTVEPRSADTQAIYLDKKDPDSPNVGVAPFYR